MSYVCFTEYNLDELPAGVKTSVEEFCTRVFGETDRLGLTSEKTGVTESKHNLIAVIALLGKIHILSEVCQSQDGLQDILARYHETLNGWNDYVETFFEETLSRIAKGFDECILAPYHFCWQTRHLLADPNDLYHFRCQRDNIELFLGGASKLSVASAWRKSIETIDIKMKEFIIGEISPRMQEEWNISVLKSDDVEWLPDGFWWRHLGNFADA